MNLERTKLSDLQLIEWKESGQRVVVLGKRPGYTDLAEKLIEEGVNAVYFHVPNEEWDLLSREECWQKNKSFLDSEVFGRRNVIIILSNYITNLDDVTGYFGRELDYLMALGYRIEEGVRIVK